MRHPRLQMNELTRDLAAAALQRYRKAAGLKQKDAALRAGIHIACIGHFENGRRTSTMSIAQLFSLLNVYKVSLATFERDMTLSRDRVLREIA